MKARFYNPLLGRFLSADSIDPDYEYAQSLNRYSYVLNNPMRYTDPMGHVGGVPGRDPNSIFNQPPTCDVVVMRTTSPCGGQGTDGESDDPAVTVIPTQPPTPPPPGTPVPPWVDAGCTGLGCVATGFVDYLRSPEGALASCRTLNLVLCTAAAGANADRLLNFARSDCAQGTAKIVGPVVVFVGGGYAVGAAYAGGYVVTTSAGALATSLSAVQYLALGASPTTAAYNLARWLATGPSQARSGCLP